MDTLVDYYHKINELHFDGYNQGHFAGLEMFMKQSSKMKFGYAILWIALSLVSGIWGHPICLNFDPPFENKDLQFCMEYTDFGCCTVADDLAIQSNHSRIISSTGNDACGELLRRVMCLTCHPYAGHIFDAEVTLVATAFPGLCVDFCGQFYDSCHETIPMLTNDQNTLISAQSRELFCEQIKARDPEYCYPDLDNDPRAGNVIQGSTVDGCVCLEEFALGLRNPLAFRVPPDGSQRIFIAEQIGVVYIYHPDKTRNLQPFMDLQDSVYVTGRSGDERGFLGLAFHPEYATNRRLFVYYYTISGFLSQTRLSEFLANPSNPDKVDVNSERPILEIPQPYGNHNGGDLFFGVDGYLYLTLGDGGAGGDPQNYAQNLESLLGKVIRLDVDSPTEDSYAIPAGNPFIDVPGARPEIYAYGIRNIWRCDVDEGDAVTGYGHGRIICGDVGQNNYEEIDIIKRGANYGWNTREGYECYRQDLCGTLDEEELPIHAYPRRDGRSVTGGHVYRGCMNPNFYGKYFFGDFAEGNMWTLEEDTSSGEWTRSDLKTCGPDVCSNGLTGSYPRNIMSFGEDADGEIYLLTTSYPSSTDPLGTVFKFVDPRRRGDPTTCRTNIGEIVS